MRQHAFYSVTCLVLFVFSGFNITTPGVSGGEDCDVQSINKKPCNDYLPGCFGEVGKCHNSGSPTGLCDEGGGPIVCNNHATDPDCLGTNTDGVQNGECDEDPVPWPFPIPWPF